MSCNRLTQNIQDQLNFQLMHEKNILYLGPKTGDRFSKNAANASR
jgi:hypothetical protein